MNRRQVAHSKPRLAGLAAALAAALALAFPALAAAVGPGGWDHLGPGLNDSVRALNTDAPGQLLVGGRFTDAGGNPAADKIASWDGTTWSPLGPADSLEGAASFVNAIAYANGKVYAGGTFGDGAGGKPDNLAVWDGVSWQQFCANVGGPVDALEVIGSKIYVGGSFTNVNADPAADNLIECDLTTGNYVGPTVDSDGDVGGRIQALVADSAGNLYAGGQFINMDGILTADYVARFDGAGWHTMGFGIGGPPAAAIDTANVDSLATDGTNIYVGTDDDDVAGIPQADHVARWDGTNWNAVGSNTASGDGYFPAGGLTAINGLLVSGSNLYATGEFANANGDPLADDIAIFDGTSWNHLGSNGFGNGPFNGTGNALAFFGGAPVLGGGFVDAGGDVQADRITTFPPPAPPAPPDPTPLPAPVLTGTIPNSPANNNYPSIKGEPYPEPSGSTLLYVIRGGTSCSPGSPFDVTGGHQQFAFLRPLDQLTRPEGVNPESGVSLPDNSTTTFYAIVNDPNSSTGFSACSNAITYTEVSPSSDISFGKVKKNVDKGTAKLVVDVPGPGTLGLAGKSLKPVSKQVQEGETTLPVKAKGKLARKLADQGKVSVLVEVTFTPTDGDEATESIKVKLKQKP